VNITGRSSGTWLIEALGLFIDSPLGQAAADAEKDLFEEEEEKSEHDNDAEQAEGAEVLGQIKH